MSVTLRQPLTLDECLRIGEWRNDPSVMPMLRTGYKTPADQEAFYHEHISPPWWRRWVTPKEHEYYAIEYHGAFVGIGGLTHLTRKPGQAEISLVLGPMYRGAGIGTQAVDALLSKAWRLGLRTVIGECYPRGAIKFWTKQVLARPEVTQFYWRMDGTLTWKWERP